MNQVQLGGVVPVWTMTDRLAKARTYASLSQQELADALGISERTVKRYEAGSPYKRGLILGWGARLRSQPEMARNGRITAYSAAYRRVSGT